MDRIFNLFIYLFFFLGSFVTIGTLDSYGAVRRLKYEHTKASPSLNVRIAKNQKKLRIEGMDLRKTIGQNVKKYPGKNRIEFNCANNKSAAKSRPILFASLSSPTGLISWNKKHYRGQLKVSTAKNQNSCDLIYSTSMENYISALLSKEMDPYWPVEALKAQAVAARTYALDKLKKSMNSSEAIFDLENSEKHQVHGTFFDESPKTKRAADETGGYVLTAPNGKLVPAFFHSKCGGKTFRPEHVWANRVSGYRKTIQCPYCKSHGTKNWSRWFSRNKISNIIYKALNNDKISFKKFKKLFHLVPSKKTSNEIRFYVDGMMGTMKKSKIRKVLGRKIIPSNNFAIKQTKKGFRIYGAGFGHGVGLCQYGAFEMARQGKNFKEILAHYYPHLKLTKVY